MMLTGFLIVLAGAAEGLLQNTDFSKGLEQWTVNAPAGVEAAVAVEAGRPCAEMNVGDGAQVGWPGFYQEFAVAPGRIVRFSTDVQAKDIRDGFGAYLSVEFLDAAGRRVSFGQSEAAPRNGSWKTLRIMEIAPKGTARGRVCLILNGRGTARFAGVSLSLADGPESTPPDGPVTITVTGDTACASLIGFGAEDDGWFYNQENAAKGVTREDWAVREGRIEWMQPDWVRMFFWYMDFNPSGDWETFDFDSDNMRSHYQTLDLYQKLGARVNVVGVEWGVKDPYGDAARAAKAIGALMEHLIKAKGYTCVTEWTLTNEPNGYFIGKGYDFRRFAELHRLVRAEFDRRGLKVRIVGSDDTGGFDFFSQCVNDEAYYGLADYFASHRYIQHGSRPLMSDFLDERLGLLAARAPGKQLVVAEFGFHDGRSGALENPIMEEYDYALWTSAFVIEGLNKGVAGFSVWCLHEVYYPGNGFMNYGLWNYKDDGWKPRPVYHAWAPFSRFTKTGDSSRRCESTHPAHVSAAFTGNTLFWVNQTGRDVEIVLKGAVPETVRIMTEATLSGDRDCGVESPLKDGKFTAPPRSFGYAR